MSGGSSIPYHLRQNKAIERNLFVDLLSRIGRYYNISDYAYIGFGGPFLEDFKHIHSSLRIRKMISLEVSANVFERQKFNRPVSCVELLHKSSGAFLTEHDFNEQTAIWFDYAIPSETGIQLAETQRLVAKLNHGDVFKITLNATPETLGKPKDGSDLREYRLAQAQDRLGDYAPGSMAVDDISFKNYPKTLLAALHRAAQLGVESSPRLRVQPLTAFVYSDGQQMITATGIVLFPSERERFMQKTRLAHWPFSNFEWKAPKSISVPAMSVKERLEVESLLPEHDTQQIFENLGYYIGADGEEATGLMRNFVDFYRLYPWYSRVVM
jgi:hypothetical protein